MSSVDTDPGALITPRLGRRLACFAYEGVLLFGVTMTAGLVYGVATQQRDALVGTVGLRTFMFAVLALYFVHFWTRGGQTLAMKTWQVRLVTADGQPVRPLRALCRYLLAWMWFLPALATLSFSGVQGATPVFAAIVSGVLGYAALVWLHPDRQYWHDVVCKTRIVTWHTPPRKPKQ